MGYPENAGVNIEVKKKNNQQPIGVRCQVNLQGNWQQNVSSGYQAKVGGNMEGIIENCSQPAGMGCPSNVVSNGHQHVRVGYPANVVNNIEKSRRDDPQPVGVECSANVGSNFRDNGNQHAKKRFPQNEDGYIDGRRYISVKGFDRQRMNTSKNVSSVTKPIPNPEETSRELPRAAREQSEVSSSSNAGPCFLKKVQIIGEKKNKRATPSNPKKYTTLCKVWIRGGKSVNAAIIGYLEEGQTVVINQVKGLSGRIVEIEENGKNNNIGWVYLNTRNGRQLLRAINGKYDRKRK